MANPDLARANEIMGIYDEDTPLWVHVSVHVFKNLDYDSKSTRHVGLWIELYEDDYTTRHHFGLLHATGPKQGFIFNADWGFNTTQSKSFRAEVDVAWLPQQMSRNEVQDMFQSEENVKMKNDDPEFNCQLWLTFALQYLVKREWITEDEFTSIISQVDDYVIEPEMELMEDGYE